MPDVEELTTQALRLLRSADVSGRSGTRDAGISVVHAALQLAPDGWPRASEVALRCAGATRARSPLDHRCGGGPVAAADLTAAHGILEQALAIERRPDWRADLAELARPDPYRDHACDHLGPCGFQTSPATHGSGSCSARQIGVPSAPGRITSDPRPASRPSARCGPGTGRAQPGRPSDHNTSRGSHPGERSGGYRPSAGRTL